MPPDPPAGTMFAVYDDVAEEWIIVPVASVTPLARPAPGLRRRASGHLSTDVVVAGAAMALDRTRAWNVATTWDADTTEEFVEDLRALLRAPGYPWFGGALVDLDDPVQGRVQGLRKRAGQQDGTSTLTFTFLERVAGA